jgi:hypothetical protein
MNASTRFGMEMKPMGGLAAGTAVGLAVAISVTGLAGPAFSEPTTAAVTIPFEMDHNRMFIEVEFVGADGTSRKARAWVDTGSEVLVLQEPLARDLGYEVPEGKEEWVPLPKAPGVRLNGWPLDSGDVVAGVLRGPLLRPGLLSAAQLPASLFRNHDVVFDYPARRLTVARPGLLKPHGVPVPCRINPKTGLFLVDAILDGEAVALGVDNGSSYTWVSDSLTKSWLERDPERPFSVGAVGAANFFGFGFETKAVLMRLREVRLGDLVARNVGVAGIAKGLFDWYSKKSAGPVVGFIGANLLKDFRIEVDFSNRMTYWEAGPEAESFDLDIVGLTLHPDADGGYTVVGVAVKDGLPAVKGVRPGDRLLRVDDLDTAGAAMGAVVDAMRGKPDSIRTLMLERQGKSFIVKAKTMRFA